VVETVNLCEGLEEIRELAFRGCKRISSIVIPPTVKAIKARAFYLSHSLAKVILGEGLREIGREAFAVTSIHDIVIPSSVKVIKAEAFSYCRQLTNVKLGEGLEEIWQDAFRDCTSLQQITIPPAVTRIHEKDFTNCSSLTSVVFSDEIEEFVSGESMRDWWNHGVHERSLMTYSFLIDYNIPKRLDFLRVRQWKANTHETLRHIPTISTKCVDSYFEFIHTKLSVYENLKHVPVLLELAIWKLKIAEQSNRNNNSLASEDTKMQCRTDSITMATIVVPNVLSFVFVDTVFDDVKSDSDHSMISNWLCDIDDDMFDYGVEDDYSSRDASSSSLYDEEYYFKDDEDSSTDDDMDDDSEYGDDDSDEDSNYRNEESNEEDHDDIDEDIAEVGGNDIV
jgi:hypothetical protein